MPNNDYANEPNQSRSEDIIQSILDNTEYDEAARSRIEYLLIELKNAIEGGGGGGGVTSYLPLTEKPKIDNHTLQAGNNTSSDLGLQTKLTFDSAPTEDSTNPVTSGGVYTALTSKADASNVYDKSSIDTALNNKADKSTTYTKTEVDTSLSSKQNTISDLATIRSGAAAGATAVQPISGKGLSTNDYTNDEKAKLIGIAEGAEVNVQSNWTQTTTTADDYIKNKPSLGTAAALDVAASGNASTSQVVKGNDTRLTDARNAADVSSWAKAANKPPYNGSEIALTGYTEAQSKSTVEATDTTNEAIGKLEYRVETNENNISLKANTIDVNTATANLQSQIDQIAQATGTGTADTEIAQARVNNKGLAYTTLNGRLSADETITDALIKGLINARYVSRGTEWIGKITPENTYNTSFFTTDYYTELQGSFIKSITIYAKTTGRLRLFLLPTNVIATSTTVAGYQRIFEVNISQTGVQTVTFDVPLYCPEDKVLVYSAPNFAGYKGGVTTDDQKGWMIGQESSTHVNLTLCVAFEYVKASDILLPFKPIGKKIGFIGDSITAGDGGTPYCKEVARQLGMSYYNYGHSGCSFTLSSGNTFKDYVSTYASDVDVFTIWGGINDLLWFNNWSIFEQEFESFIVTMLTNYPTAKFLIITPQKFYFTGQSTRTTAWDIETPDGKKLVDYVNVEKAIASKYQIPVLDMFEIGVPVVATSQRNTFYNGNGDWLHPNTNGYKYIVNRMVRAIESL